MIPANCAGCRLWQEIDRREPVNFGANLEHISNLSEVRILQIFEFPLTLDNNTEYVMYLEVYFLFDLQT